MLVCEFCTTADFLFSKKGLGRQILVPKPPSRFVSRCARCGTPVDGPYCQGCALLRKKFKENLFTYCVENEFFKDLQHTSESSDDNTNVVNAPQEPFVMESFVDNALASLVGKLCKRRKKKSELRKSKRLKINIGRFPFAMMMTKTIPIANTPDLPSMGTDNSLIWGTQSSTLFRNDSDEIVVNSNDDNSLSDDDSSYGEDINYVDASPPDVEIVSLEVVEIVVLEIEPDPGDLASIDPGIRKNVSTTNVNVPLEDDQSPLFAYVVWIFLAFLAYPIVPPYLLSTGNEDTIFDPDISMYHSFMPDVSHRSGTFMKFNVYPNHLNESPMMILSSTCFPMDQ
ncbi:hypothetical protein Tco_0849740 [Tanacetum coccineum]